MKREVQTPLSLPVGQRTRQNRSIYLPEAGWEVHRQKGSHVILKKSSGSGRAIVPMHPGDLPGGTLRSIIRDCGLSVETFTDYL